MRLIDKGIEVSVALLMMVLLTLVTCAVFFRYALGDPLTWSEELGRSCLVWVSFLGAYLAQRRSQHVAVTVVREALPVRYQQSIRIALALLLLGFLGVLAWFGTVYSLKFMSSTTPLLGIPLGLIYAAMPLCMALLFISVLLDFLVQPIRESL